MFDLDIIQTLPARLPSLTRFLAALLSLDEGGGSPTTLVVSVPKNTPPLLN